MFYWSITIGLFLGLMSISSNGAFGQIAYTRHLSELRIKELHHLAQRLNHSIYEAHPPCQSYYEYVCNRNQPMFSIMGNLPPEKDLIELLDGLHKDPHYFEAKGKMADFHLSCVAVKSVDDCYRETFDYFRPVFGYIVTINHMDLHDHKNIIDLLASFISRVGNTENSFITKLKSLKEAFRDPRNYLKPAYINEAYENVAIYKDGYEFNIKSLEELRKSNNSTFMHGVPKTILDWTMYMYQSQNKPMSYYMSTLNVHLWMMFYNSTARANSVQEKYFRIADCLKLPPIINALDEARLMAVIYLKSFQQAWAEYRAWIDGPNNIVNQEIYDHENKILKQYNFDNKRLFFTLYAQNFCDFGKQIAENVFFLGLKENHDFYVVYDCGHQTPKDRDCFAVQ